MPQAHSPRIPGWQGDDEKDFFEQSQAPVFLVPKETDAYLKSPAKFIKVLSNGLILIVHS